MPEKDIDLQQADFVRPKGQLEISHPEIAPLPPTLVTPDARERLESWGISLRLVEKLRVFTSSFRYDLCPEKMERYRLRDAFVYRDLHTEEVILPGFFDYMGRLDGQCGDIAVQQLRALYSEGLVREMNSALRAKCKPKIALCLASGLSRTHFNKEGDLHLWAGLVREGRRIGDMVVIDASFQEISNLEESGYQMKRCNVMPACTDNLRLHGPVPVGSMSESGDSVKLDVLGLMVGVSADKRFSCGVSFIKNKAGRFLPAVCLGHALPDVPEITCVLTEEGIRCGGPTGMMEKPHWQEVGQILNAAATINLIDDQAQARNLRDKRTAVRVGY